MKYRLKKEAVPFFKKDLACKIMDFSLWKENYNVDESAIEKVEDCFVSYGIERNGYGDLCGWSDNYKEDEPATKRGSHFCFTIHFPSMRYEEYDKFQKGKLTRELMNRIQSEINRFYTSFNNESDE